MSKHILENGHQFLPAIQLPPKSKKKSVKRHKRICGEVKIFRHYRVGCRVDGLRLLAVCTD